MLFSTTTALLFLLVSTAQSFSTKSAPSNTCSLGISSISPFPRVLTTGNVGDPTKISLYYVSTDGSMRYRTATKGKSDRYTWSKVNNMGGNFAANTPAVVNYKGSAFACGIATSANTLCAVYDKSQGCFKDWINIGGHCLNSPAAAYLPKSDEMVVIVRGSDSSMWYSTGSPNDKFSVFNKLGGHYYDSPRAAVLRDGEKEFIIYVGFGADHFIYYQIYCDKKWSPITKTSFGAAEGWQFMNLNPSDYDSGSGLYKSVTLIARSNYGKVYYATYSKERDWSNLLDFDYEVAPSFSACDARNGTLTYYTSKDKVLYTSSFGSSICGNRYSY